MKVIRFKKNILISMQLFLSGMLIFSIYSLFSNNDFETNIIIILALVLNLFLLISITMFRLEYNSQFLIKKSLFYRKKISIEDIGHLVVKYNFSIRIYNTKNKILFRITNDFEREGVLEFIKSLDSNITIIDDNSLLS